MKRYGLSLLLDLHDCDVSKFNRKVIAKYFDTICERIKMTKCRRHWWDDLNVPEEYKQTEPHTKGTSAIQFILTSDIRIHTLDILKIVYVDIFSCKSFDPEVAKATTLEFFGGRVVQCKPIDRL